MCRTIIGIAPSGDGNLSHVGAIDAEIACLFVRQLIVPFLAARETSSRGDVISDADGLAAGERRSGLGADFDGDADLVRIHHTTSSCRRSMCAVVKRKGGGVWIPRQTDGFLLHCQSTADKTDVVVPAGQAAGRDGVAVAHVAVLRIVIIIGERAAKHGGILSADEAAVRDAVIGGRIAVGDFPVVGRDGQRSLGDGDSEVLRLRSVTAAGGLGGGDGRTAGADDGEYVTADGHDGLVAGGIGDGTRTDHRAGRNLEGCVAISLRDVAKSEIARSRSNRERAEDRAGIVTFTRDGDGGRTGFRIIGKFHLKVGVLDEHFAAELDGDGGCLRITIEDVGIRRGTHCSTGEILGCDGQCACSEGDVVVRRGQSCGNNIIWPHGARHIVGRTRSVVVLVISIGERTAECGGIIAVDEARNVRHAVVCRRTAVSNRLVVGLNRQRSLIDLERIGRGLVGVGIIGSVGDGGCDDGRTGARDADKARILIDSSDARCRGDAILHRTVASLRQRVREVSVTEGLGEAGLRKTDGTTQFRDLKRRTPTASKASVGCRCQSCSVITGIGLAAGDADMDRGNGVGLRAVTEADTLDRRQVG